jgi:hypothetical protein
MMKKKDYDVRNIVNSVHELNKKVEKMKILYAKSTCEDVNGALKIKKKYAFGDEIRKYNIEFGVNLGEKLKFLQRKFAKIGYTSDQTLTLAITNGINKIYYDAQMISNCEDIDCETLCENDEMLKILMNQEVKFEEDSQRIEKENAEELVLIKRNESNFDVGVRSFNIKLSGELMNRIKNNELIFNRHFAISRNLGCERAIEIGIIDMFNQMLLDRLSAKEFMEDYGIYS